MIRLCSFREFVLLVPFLVTGTALAETIQGKVVAVSDGDSLTVVATAGAKHRVRLAEIDAPERKQSFGGAARKSLSEICLKKPVAVDVVEIDKHKRVIGRVKCGEVDASSEQVRRGMAWVSRGTLPNSPLPEMEANARLRAIGLWSGKNPEPPWQWRKRHAEPAKTAQ